MWDKRKIKGCLKPAAITKKRAKHIKTHGKTESHPHNNVSGNYRKLLFYACAVWSRGVFGTPSCFSFRSLQAVTAALRRSPSCTPELKNWDDRAHVESRRNLRKRAANQKLCPDPPPRLSGGLLRGMLNLVKHIRALTSIPGRPEEHARASVCTGHVWQCANQRARARLAPDAARGG